MPPLGPVATSNYLKLSVKGKFLLILMRYLRKATQYRISDFHECTCAHGARDHIPCSNTMQSWTTSVSIPSTVSPVAACCSDDKSCRAVAFEKVSLHAEKRLKCSKKCRKRWTNEIYRFSSTPVEIDSIGIASMQVCISRVQKTLRT